MEWNHAYRTSPVNKAHDLGGRYKCYSSDLYDLNDITSPDNKEIETNYSSNGSWTSKWGGIPIPGSYSLI